MVRRQYRLWSLPLARPRCAPPASIITCAHEPWATMWMVEFVKKVITGHMKTPMKKASPGHR